jgi:lipoyl(octanoyl) transferase
MSSSSTDERSPSGPAGRVEIRRHSPDSPWTYGALDRRQRAVADAVRAGEKGTLLLSEVAPVVTLGMRNTAEDVLDPCDLACGGVSIFLASRGGRATWHGPGQWIAFPVDSVERLVGDRKGVRKVVDGLIAAGLEVCRERYPGAECRSGEEVGIWAGPERSDGKLVAFGVRFDRGVLQHGLAMNVFKTGTSFVGIRPCGLDAPVAWLEDAPDEVAFVRWGKRLEQALLARFPSLGG